MGYFGKYKATVKDTADSRKLGQIRCFCPAIMGEVDSPDSWLGWAMPSLYFSSTPSGDYGSLCVPEVGDTVWLSFEQGNLDFPVYEGGWPTGDSSSESSVPALGKGQSDGSEGTERSHRGVEVPASAAGSSQYPLNRMFRTKAGHIVEVDDTAANKRLRVRHSTGTFLEFQHSGSLVVQAMASLLLWVATSLRLSAVADIVLASAVVRLGSNSASRGVARLNDTVGSFGTITALAPPGGGAVTFTVTPASGLPVVGASMTLSGAITSASSTTFSD